MDALAALRLLMEWGADEALADTPVDRRSDPGRAAGAAPAGLPRPHPPSALPRPQPDAPPRPTVRAPSQAATVEELRAALAAFDGCALRTTAKSFAFADGTASSGLVLIGEAPSDDDDREGRPFSGPGGAQLDRVFASVGLDRTGMLLTLLVPWRPPGKRAPSPAEIAACLPFLHRHLALLGPRRLVLFGGGVTRALGLGTEPIGRLRGVWRDVAIPGLGTVPALPMRPIDSALKSAPFKQELWHDLLSLRAALHKDGESRAAQVSK